MENGNMTRAGIMVSIRDGILTPLFYIEFVMYSIAPVISLIIILTTIFLEPFKSADSVKGVVIFQCFSTLVYNTILIFKYLTSCILLLNKTKVSIMFTTILSQIIVFAYNFNYTVPFFISYWRFSLIILGRKTSIFEKIGIGCFSMIFNFIAFIYTIFFTNDIQKTSFYTGIYVYGSYTESVFSWFDTVPQVIGCCLGIILNLTILRKIWKHQKSMKNKSTSVKNDVSITLNTLFHAIMPFILIIFYNIYYNVLINYDIQINTLRLFFKYIEIFYLTCCPLSFLIFIEIYRSRMVNFFCPNNEAYKRKTTRIISISRITNKSIV